MEDFINYIEQIIELESQNDPHYGFVGINCSNVKNTRKGVFNVSEQIIEDENGTLKEVKLYEFRPNQDLNFGKE